MAQQKHSGFKALGDIDMDSHKVNNEPDLKALKVPWNDEGLVLHLPFSENQGEIAKDASHYGNHGKFKGAGEPAWAEGRRGPAVDFDGSDDYVDCENDASLNPADAITLEAWIYPASIVDVHRIIDKFATSPYYGWSVYTSDQQLGFQLYTTELSTLATGNVLTEANKWYHVVFTYDGAYMRIYVNGVSVVTPLAKTGTITYTNTPNVRVGISTNFAQPFDGLIDEVRIYNRALSADEVLMHYLRSFSAGMPEYISRARAYRGTSNQTITTDTWTKVQLNSKSYDEQGEFDSITNYRFTAKKAGYYQVIGQVYWDSSVDQSPHSIAFYVNGVLAQHSYLRSSGNSYFMSQISDIIHLTAGDYIELYVRQETGGNVDINWSEYVTFLSIHKLS